MSTREVRVTSKNVTDLFNLRTALWSANGPVELDQVAKEYQLPVGDPKFVLQSFFEKTFPTSANNGEHFQRMQARERIIRELFTSCSSEVSLMLFGSYSLGTINGRHSDLDYLVIAGRNSQDIAAFEQLEQAGVIVSPELSQVDRIGQIIETGRGLARIYAVSEDGIEVEFHVLGTSDVMEIHKLKPGFVERITPVPPKNETRLSYRGKAMEIPKGPDFVKHHITVGDEVYKGFFPDAIILGSLVLDPHGVGKEVFNNVWYASVKAYLYHNNLLRRLENGMYGIDLDNIDFDTFLSTVMPQKKSFTPERYMACYEVFKNVIQQIITRFKLIPVQAML